MIRESGLLFWGPPCTIQGAAKKHAKSSTWQHHKTLWCANFTAERLPRACALDD